MAVFQHVNAPITLFKTSWILTVPIAQSDHDKPSVEGNLSTWRGWFSCHLGQEALLSAPSLRQWKIWSLARSQQDYMRGLAVVPSFNMAVRWFCWSTDLVSKCSLLGVCTHAMASKESLGRVRHFNLISQQVCDIFCLWICSFSTQCYFSLCPSSNIERSAYMFRLMASIGLQSHTKTKCSALLFKIAPSMLS